MRVLKIPPFCQEKSAILPANNVAPSRCWDTRVHSNLGGKRHERVVCNSYNWFMFIIHAVDYKQVYSNLGRKRHKRLICNSFMFIIHIMDYKWVHLNLARKRHKRLACNLHKVLQASSFIYRQKEAQVGCL